jgi:uncharacterized protein YegP (UPF0339 family)
MLHLTKRKDGKFEVVNVGENGEMLSTTTQGFEKKAECYKNMIAQSKPFNGFHLFFQDDTHVKISVYVLYFDGSKEKYEIQNPQPKYIPGKNPRKKKTVK